MDLATSTKLMRVYWELPKRTNSEGKRRPNDDGMLRSYESYKLVDQIASFTHADIHFVGGPTHPHHTDLFQLIDYASRRRVKTLYSPPWTRLTRETIEHLSELGLGTIAIPIHGSTAELHESASTELGAFDAAIITVLHAMTAGLEVRIDTTFTRDNIDDFANLALLVAETGAKTWNVSVGFGKELRRFGRQLSADEVEALFRQIFLVTEAAAFKVEVTHARHYRRFLLQQLMAEKKRRLNTVLDPSMRGDAEISVPSFCEVDEGDSYRHAEREIIKQRASIFVGPDGTVWPERRLQFPVGHIGVMPLQRVATHPFLLRLRNPDELRGKCSACEFRELCGGSRARAYDVTGDPFEGDPLCAYQPARWGARRDAQCASGTLSASP